MKKQPELLNETYWSDRYKNNTAAWDMGRVSPPLKAYFDQLVDKDISILIPGCGNAYEAAYLLKNGFTNVTLIDISPLPVQKLRRELTSYLNNELHIICGDFFALNQTFDLIIEQTFFCAIDPSLRHEYVEKMKALLTRNGKLVGVFFNRLFDGGPPFSGSKVEYNHLFKDNFQIKIMDECYNSISPRKSAELFIILLTL